MLNPLRDKNEGVFRPGGERKTPAVTAACLEGKKLKVMNITRYKSVRGGKQREQGSTKGSRDKEPRRGDSEITTVDRRLVRGGVLLA